MPVGYPWDEDRGADLDDSLQQRVDELAYALWDANARHTDTVESAPWTPGCCALTVAQDFGLWLINQDDNDELVVALIGDEKTRDRVYLRYATERAELELGTEHQRAGDRRQYLTAQMNAYAADAYDDAAEWAGALR